jgi:hypothetical protein
VHEEVITQLEQKIERIKIKLQAIIAIQKANKLSKPEEKEEQIIQVFSMEKPPTETESSQASNKKFKGSFMSNTSPARD